ncbi:energy-coupling factor transporter transmembrane protein EcfT [Paenibacillus sp. N3/727]|uniref:energy-coupling factor transporter transmembrane component T n=1 Tax=Paenibacillus sp. N3/727 TaxID=2925845 RepID=UPI001F52CBEE|nr:energy-coupling factor transporter transmembrane component T [Paenibacillus sp. N3/727]UNK17239.1 energy-coupling factor transporter transmembrane protein EcfT [Paenibacillus sp. N3/727]
MYKQDHVPTHISAIKLDPRMKIYLLLLANVAVFVSPSFQYELILMAMIFLLCLLMGVYSFSLKMILGYGSIIAVQLLSEKFLSGAWELMFVSFAMFIRKIYPCVVLGGLLVGTTKINEFMTALTKIRISKKAIIPLAVMLRYFPMIGEDWRYIKDAMKLRGISPSAIGFLKQPVLTVECVYVPLLMAASKIADELAAASITRGIENPKERTCYQQVSFQFIDVLTALLFTFYVVAGVFIC